MDIYIYIYIYIERERERERESERENCKSSFVCTQLNGFEYCYIILVILFLCNANKLHIAVWFQITNKNNNPL